MPRFFPSQIRHGNWLAQQVVRKFRAGPPLIKNGMMLATICLAFASSLSSSVRAAEQPAKKLAPGSPEAQRHYQQTIVPVLKKYCFRCHGAEQAKAEIKLSGFASPSDLVAARGTWESALEMIESELMPPDDQPQPDAEQRRTLAAWLEGTLFYVDCEGPVDPGRETIQRLNRAEYNNTVRDLLGVEITPADDFPSDDVGEGFDNIGDVLSLPPLLMEKYLDAAEQVAEAAIVAHNPEQTPRRRRERDKLQAKGAAKLNSYGVYGVNSTGGVASRFDLPREGEYLIRVKAGADQAGDEKAQMEIRVDGKAVQTHTVTASRDDRTEHEYQAQLDKGSHQIEAWFVNDYYNPKAADPNDRDRNLFIEWLEVQGPVDLPLDDLPESHQRLFVSYPSQHDEKQDDGDPQNAGQPKSAEQAAREVLEPYLMRAYRRPVTEDDLEPLLRLVRVALDRDETYERAVQLAVTASLASPHFLFRIEQDPAPDDPQQRHRLNDYEIASRLSYFLWSSMPDEELFRLAGEDRLHQPEVLASQVRRMLADSKANQLVENFGGQWLNLRNLEEVTPDPAQFPDFDERLRDDMKRETLLFFETVMREDRSLTEFINGRFTLVNERLAKFYGLPEVKGEAFQKVALGDVPRAGVLTQASILTLTSNPTRTSPVKRGKWIMENILGAPPPDPPPGIPELEETQEASPNATLREQLELHRASESCAVCHRKMDALGFGFENFDAIGRWRDKEGNFPIDASGTLPNGGEFQGPRELVEILSESRRGFCRSITEKMLIYALGRGLEYYDRCAVDKILSGLEEKDYRFSELVIGIVQSDPFLMRRGEAP